METHSHADSCFLLFPFRSNLGPTYEDISEALISKLLTVVYIIWQASLAPIVTINPATTKEDAC